MRILQVIHYFLPEKIGGAELQTFYSSKELSKKHQIFIFSERKDRTEKKYTTLDREYKGLSIRRVMHDGLYENFSQSVRDKRLAGEFRKFIILIDPDIIHFQYYAGLNVGLFQDACESKRPFIITLRDYGLLCQSEIPLLKPDLSVCQGPEDGAICAKCFYSDKHTSSGNLYFQQLEIRNVVRKKYIKKIILKAKCIISPSTFLKQKYVEYGIPSDLIKVIPNHTFAPMSKINRRLDYAKIRFGYIGTLSKRKGIEVLLNAFKIVKRKYKDVELNIFGWGYNQDYISALKKMSIKSISFKGEYLPQELPSVLSDIDILVFPSIWFENCPNVIMEAHSAGIPVVASNIGAVPERIKDRENGLLFNTGDADDLACKMERFIEEPSLAERLRNKIVKPSNMKEYSEKLERLYEEFI